MTEATAGLQPPQDLQTEQGQPLDIPGQEPQQPLVPRIYLLPDSGVARDVAKRICESPPGSFVFLSPEEQNILSQMMTVELGI